MLNIKLKCKLLTPDAHLAYITPFHSPSMAQKDFLSLGGLPKKKEINGYSQAKAGVVICHEALQHTDIYPSCIHSTGTNTDDATVQQRIARADLNSEQSKPTYKMSAVILCFLPP